MSRNRCDGLLAKVDFPLYTLETLTNRHVLVAGGGGASNTGVANGFEIFEISHNGNKFVAEEVMRHETGPNVVMNCSIRNAQGRTYMCAGQESHCQLYRVNVRMVDVAEMRRGSFRAENGLVRRRRRTVSENDNISKADIGTVDKRMSFEIRPCDSVQTDFGDDPLQRVVRISHNGKLMATGGVDGKVRVWSFPQMQLLFQLEGHTKELDDLDFSPCDSQLVSIGKDGLALVWGVAGGAGAREPLRTLSCQPPNGTKYRFRRCRFGASAEVMFTIANPVSRAGSGRARGLLQQWAWRGAGPESGGGGGGGAGRTVLLPEALSALAVRDDGKFLAVGTMFSGSVHIYIAFSLQRVLQVKNAHGMFVTGLAFLPVGAGGSGGATGGAGGAGQALASRSEAALLSISVDNCLYVHSVPYPRTVPAWVAIILIVFVLFCTFTLCSYLGI